LFIIKLSNKALTKKWILISANLLFSPDNIMLQRILLFQAEKLAEAGAFGFLTWKSQEKMKIKMTEGPFCKNHLADYQLQKCVVTEESDR
jgi:hypothetical protein